MTNNPVGIIAGKGLGVSHSSLNQIGPVNTVNGWGPADIKVFVNIATSNLFIKDNPLRVVDHNGPQEIGFVYNSNVASTRDTWRLNIAQLKTPISPEAKQITLIEEDGHETIYTVDPHTATRYWGTTVSAGTPWMEYQKPLWKVYYPDTGIIKYFDPQGKLIKKQDAQGNITTYEHANNLIKIIYPSQDTYLITQSGNEVKIQQQVANTLVLLKSYEMDKLGRIKKSVIHKEKSNETYTVCYQYEADDAISDPKARFIHKITQTESTGSDNKKDCRDLYFNWDLSNCHLLSVRAASGIANFTEFKNITAEKVTVLDGKDIPCEIKVNDGCIVEVARQPSKQFTKEFKKSDSFVRTQYAYQVNKKLKSITHPGGGIESWDYYDTASKENGMPVGLGMLKSYTNAAGEKSSHYYDGYTLPKLSSIAKESLLKRESLVSRFVYWNVASNSNEDYRSFLQYKIDPCGNVTGYSPLSNAQLVPKFKRQYAANRYKKENLRYDNFCPQVENVNEWAAKQNKQNVTLAQFDYDNLLQPLITQRFSSVDDKGVGEKKGASYNYHEHDHFGNLSRETIRQKEDEKIYPVTEYKHDILNRLHETEDAYAQTTGEEYRDSKNQHITTHPNGQQIVLTFAANGGLLAKAVVAKEKERITSYRLDEMGLPAVTIYPDKTQAVTAYDSQQRLIAEVSPTGRAIEYYYNDISRYKQTIQYAKLADISYLSKYPDAAIIIDAIENLSKPEEGRVSYAFFDKAGRTKYQVDAAGYIKEFLRDEYGRPAGEIAYHQPIDESLLKKLKNGNDIELKVDFNEDRVQQVFYNPAGKKIAERDPAGYIIEYKRDTAGRIIEKICYATPSNENEFNRNAIDIPKVDILPGQDAHTYYFYNARDQVTKEVDAKGYVTEYEYYPNSKIKTSTRYANKINEAWLQEINKLAPTAKDMPKTSDEDLKTEYDYDLLEREIASSDSFGRHTTTQYDEMDRVIFKNTRDVRSEKSLKDEKEPDADKTRTTLRYYDGFGDLVAEANAYTAPVIAPKLAAIDQNAQLTREQKRTAKADVWKNAVCIHHEYNDLGLRIKTIDSLGRTTFFYYDEEKRPVLTLDAMGGVVEQDYSNLSDLLFHRVYATRLDTKSSDFKNITENTNGSINKAIKEIIKKLRNDEKDALTKFENHDKRGFAQTKIDPEGNTYTYKRNAFGEVSEEKIPVADKKPSLTITHKYNTRGQETETKRETAGLEAIVTTAEYKNMYGKITKETNAVKVDADYQYDTLGNLTEKKIKDYKHNYTTDAFGRPETETNSLGQTTEHQYNQKDRTHTIITPEEKAKEKTKLTITSNIFGEKVKVANAKQSEEWKHAPDGQVTHQIDRPSALEERITQSNYNTEGKCEWQLNPNEIKTSFIRNKVDQLIERIDDDGKKDDPTKLRLSTTYEPNVFGKNERVIEPSPEQGNATVTTAHEFDRNGNAKKTTIENVDNKGLNLITQNDHNAQGEKIQVTCGDSNKLNQWRKSTQVDGFNRVVGNTIDPEASKKLNNELKHINETKDEVIPLNIQTQQTLDDVGRVVVNTDPKGNCSYTFYNNCGYERFKISPQGGVTESIYNDENQVIAEKSYTKPIDMKGVNEKTSLSDLAEKIKPDSLTDTVLKHFYDKNGRKRFTVSVGDPDEKTGQCGVVKEWQWNEASQEMKTIEYATKIDIDQKLDTKILEKQMTELHNDNDDRINYCIRDNAGQPRFLIDAMGVITEQQFSKTGKIIATITYDHFFDHAAEIAKSTVDDMVTFVQPYRENARVNYNIYDSLDRIQFQINGENAVTYNERNFQNKLTKMARFSDKVPPQKDYESLVKLLKTWPAKIDKEKDRVIEIKYDKAGRIDKVMDPLGNEDVYQHDALDNQLSQTDRNEKEWKREYDRANRLIFEIDPERLITEVSMQSNGKLGSGESKTPVRKKIDYDKASNIEKITHAINTSSKREVEYKFNAHNQLNQSLLKDAHVDDQSKDSSFDPKKRPDKDSQTLTTQVIYDGRGFKLAKKNHGESWFFYVRNTSGQLRYKLRPLTKNADGTVTYQVTEFDRDAFGKIAKKTIYANVLELDPKKFNQEGVSSQFMRDAAQKLVDKVNDRHTFYTRNRQGKITSVIKDPVYYFYDETDYGSREPEARYDYNPFGERVSQKVKLGKDKFAHNMWWRDRAGHVVAECNAVKAVKRYTLNTFGEEEKRCEYANYLESTPEYKKSVSGLDKLIQDELIEKHKNEKKRDRTFKTTYNLLGKKATETQIGVTRYKLVPDKINPLSSYMMYKVEALPERDLTRTFNYGKTGLPESITLEDGKSQLLFFYDACGTKTAEVGIAFQAEDIETKNPPRVFRALTTFGIDAHHQAVATTRYKNGAVVDEKNQLQPAKPDINDQTSLTLLDNRGLATLKQDPMGYLTGFTYTPTRQVAREWWNLRNWMVVKDEKGIDVPIPKTDIDEKRSEYNCDKKLKRTEIRRNNNKNFEQATDYKRNAFSEVTGEGKGNGSFYIYHENDLQGNTWNSNHDGIQTVTLRNLAGHPTLQIQSTTIDQIKDKKYSELETLIKSQDEAIAKTFSIHDAAGRLKDKISPACAPSFDNGTYWPLQMQFKNNSIIWPKILDQNVRAPSISLRSAGQEGDWKEYKIGESNDKDNNLVNAAQLPGDNYQYRIFYYPPGKENDEKSKIYHSTGFIQCDTGIPGGKNSVVRVEKDSQGYLNRLALLGETTNVAKINLLNENKEKVLGSPFDVTINSSGQSTVDLSQVPSGRYTLQPVLSDGKETLESAPFTLNTAIEAKNFHAQKISCHDVKLQIEDKKGCLTWQVSDEFKHSPVKLKCEYISDTGEKQTQDNIIIEPEDYEVVESKDPLWNIKFDFPIKQMTSISLDVQSGETKEWLPLYKNEIPMPQLVATSHPAPKHPDLEMVEHSFIPHPKSQAGFLLAHSEQAVDDSKILDFAPSATLYLKGRLLSDDEKIEILDVSLGLIPEWKALSVTKLSNGMVVDVTGFPPGNYPFKISKKNDPEKCERYQFSITDGFEVYNGEDLNTNKKTETPKRSFTYDPWNNVLKEINSLKQETNYQYNDMDRCIKKELPLIQVFPNGVTPVTSKPVTEYFHNLLGFQIAEKDPNGYIKGFIVNEIGGLLKRILGDGTPSRYSSFDALSHMEFRFDARKNKWIYNYNKNNQPTSLLSPEGKLREREYNEKTGVCKETDGNRNSNYYNHDARGNIKEHILPVIYFDEKLNLIQKIRVSSTEFDHNCVITKKITPEGVRTWQLDDFGHAQKHVDLGGAVFTYERNGKNQIKKETSSGNIHSFFRTLKLVVFNLNKSFIYDGVFFYIKDAFSFVFSPNPEKHQEFKHDANGRVVEIRDNALGKIKVYEYDTEDRITGARIYDFSGNMIRNFRTTYNAAGFEIEHVDTNVTVQMRYDASSNRTSVIVQENNREISKKENTFDQADRVLKEGTTEYSYYANLRYTEKRETKDGPISSILAHDKDESLTAVSGLEPIVRELDRGGRLSKVHQLRDDKKHFMKYVSAYDSTNRVMVQTSRKEYAEELPSILTGLEYNDSVSMNEPSVQKTFYVKKDMKDVMTSFFVNREIPLLWGTFTQRTLEKKTSDNWALRFYDVNQNLTGALGTVDPDKKKPAIIIFDTAPDGQVLSETIILEDTLDDNISLFAKRIMPLYTASGQVFGTLTKQLRPTFHPSEISEAEFNLLQGHTTSETGGVLYGMAKKVMPHDGLFKRVMKQPHLNRHPSAEFKSANVTQEVGVNYPPTVPTKITPQPGDNWQTLASRYGMGGDADKIEGAAWGMPLEPGWAIEVSEFEACHNKAGDYVNYAQFINKFVGALQPHIVTPLPPRDSPGFMDILVKAIAGVVAIAVASLLPPSMPFFVPALVAGMTDAGVQALGVVLGLEKDISWSNVFQSAATAGALSAFGVLGKAAGSGAKAGAKVGTAGAQAAAVATEAPATLASRYALAAITASTASQVTNLMTGHGFNAKEIVMAGFTGYVQALTGIKLGSALQSSGLSQAQARLVLGGVNTALGSAVTSAVNGAAPDLRVMAAQYVGSQAGQTAVDVAADQIDHLTHGINQTSKPRDLSQANQRESQTRSSARNQQTANRQLDRKLETREADAHGGDMRSPSRRAADEAFIRDMESDPFAYGNLPRAAGLNMNDPMLNGFANNQSFAEGELSIASAQRQASSTTSSVVNNRSSFWNTAGKAANAVIDSINTSGKWLANTPPVRAINAINPILLGAEALNNAIGSFRNGDIAKGAGYTALAGASVLPVEGVISEGGQVIKYLGEKISSAGSYITGSAGGFGKGLASQAGVFGAEKAPLFKTGGLSAEKANVPFMVEGKKLPYAANTRARIIQLENERIFVRVHGEGNQARPWMMRREEVQGLTPQQIQDKFALPELPTYISEVHAPSGSYLQVGAAASQVGWGTGGGIQYQFLQRVDEGWFANKQLLENYLYQTPTVRALP